MIITNNSRTLLQSQINSSKHGVLMSVNDIVSDKQKRLHDILYNDALEKMKKEYADILYPENNPNLYIIYTEQINENGYDKPSHVIISIYNKKKNNNLTNNKITNPISRYNIDLSKWWNVSYMNDDTSNATKISDNIKSKFVETTNWSNCECIYIDYVNNIVKIHNKIDGWTKEISINKFNAINSKETVIPMSDKMNTLNTYDSFVYQFRNI